MVIKMLNNKTALVTGASRGIGKAIAIEFAKQGADVIVNYSKDEKGALEVAGEIKNLGRKSIAVKADVSDFDDVSKMFGIVRKEFGKLDILVNNAGITMDRTLYNMEPKEWNSVIKTNLSGVFNVTRNAVSLINKGGRIISISSFVGMYGNFGQTNYAASKAGIIGFTKSLAKELGKHGITVNAIAPGFIETEILNSIPMAKKKEFLGMISLGRMGSTEDVANAAVFLASGRSDYITGEIVYVTGGLIF